MSRPGLRLGHLGALTGALLVMLSLWQPWYGIDVGGAVRTQMDAGAGSLPGSWSQFAHAVVAALPSSIAISGWAGLKAADVALCLLAAVAMLLIVGAAGAFGPSVAIERGAAARAVSGLGVLALLIAVEHLLVRPGHGSPLASMVEVRRGVWIAVLGSLLMILGGASASAPERAPQTPRFEPLEPAPAPSLSANPGASVAPPGL